MQPRRARRLRQGHGCAAAQSCLPTRLPLSRCAASQICLPMNAQSPLSAFLAQRSVACKCNCRSQCIGATLIVISPHRSQGVVQAYIMTYPVVNFSPIHKIRGVPRSMELSTLRVTTASFRIFSTRPVKATLRVIGTCAKPSNVNA